MGKYIKNLIAYLISFLLILAAALANWLWPIFTFFGDTSVFRFIWLGIFFILLDALFEVIIRAIDQMRVMTEIMSFSTEVKAIKGEFRVLQKVPLSNNSKADYVIVGSSGVWLLTVQSGPGKVTFNGDDIVQKEVVLRGLLTKALEKSYSLGNIIKENVNRDFIISPVVVFSNPAAYLDSVPKNVRGVFVVSRKDAVSLVENTDIQLIDKNSIEEIYKVLKK